MEPLVATLFERLPIKVFVDFFFGSRSAPFGGSLKNVFVDIIESVHIELAELLHSALVFKGRAKLESGVEVFRAIVDLIEKAKLLAGFFGVVNLLLSLLGPSLDLIVIRVFIIHTERIL